MRSPGFSALTPVNCPEVQGSSNQAITAFEKSETFISPPSRVDQLIFGL